MLVIQGLSVDQVAASIKMSAVETLAWGALGIARVLPELNRAAALEQP